MPVTAARPRGNPDPGKPSIAGASLSQRGQSAKARSVTPLPFSPSNGWLTRYEGTWGVGVEHSDKGLSPQAFPSCGDRVNRFALGVLECNQDVYHLTCPNCACVTDSAFVRSGAVVRCPTCQHKYRIKGSHVERVVLTGPRTLDESDSVLRTDSVDIEPDEVAPVSIDDEGNVVGLSGLSELMRWSDAQGSKEKLNQRVQEEAKQPSAPPSAPPAAKPARKKPSKAKTKPGRSAQAATSRRPRGKARRKNNTQAYLIVGGLVLVLVGGGIAAVIAFGGGGQTQQETVAGGGEEVGGEQKPPEQPVDPPKGPGPGDPSSTTQVVTTPGYTLPRKPSPNPDPKFVASWIQADPTVPPADVPTVLTPGKAVLSEGWYVTTPPRGTADAVAEVGVELGEFVPVPKDEDTVVLTGSVVNRTEQTVLSGELHVMLLDSTGRVFAETYTPLLMLEAGQEHAVSLPIAKRYWDRSRGVRSGVTVTGWADEITPLPGVRLAAVGSGQSAAVRVSAKLDEGAKPMRGVMMLIKGLNDEGRAVCQYLVSEENLYVTPGEWLDVVVSTPMKPGQDVARWSALVQPR